MRSNTVRLKICGFHRGLLTGLVPRQTTALLASGVILSALLSFVCEVILESDKRGQREIKQLFYLQTSEY